MRALRRFMAREGYEFTRPRDPGVGFVLDAVSRPAPPPRRLGYGPLRPVAPGTATGQH